MIGGSPVGQLGCCPPVRIYPLEPMSNPTILEVLDGSPAAHAGLQRGDELLSVNGVVPTDVIEYQQLVDEALQTLLVRRSGGTDEISIEKQTGSPLG